MKKATLRTLSIGIVSTMLLNCSQFVYGQDIIGKLITGYQGWFSCDGDKSPQSNWVHWGDGSRLPKEGDVGFELFPDMREYTTTYQTGLANMGNGEPATLYSSYDQQVVHTHFRWMKEYGIDVAALQRFGSAYGNSSKMGHKDGVAQRVKNAAEQYDRKFYIMYDLSSWDNFQSEIKLDWTNTIKDNLDLLSSTAYAYEDGKPVVCIWGFGSNRRPGDQSSWTDVIHWFQSQGCFVIAGCYWNWRGIPELKATVEEADMITPWSIGKMHHYGDGASTVDEWYNEVVEADINTCKSTEIHYMPTIWPGFSWSNWKEGYEDKPNHRPRVHGNFMWNQFYRAKEKFDKAGSTATVYVAMFDEYDEATAIMKAAEDASMIPTDQWFLTLDADGVHCSSDFYLRLTGDGAKMIKGQIDHTINHPTPHDANTPEQSGIIYTGADIIITKTALNWSSDAIDISSDSTVTISLDIEGMNLSTMEENQDYLNIYYIVDAGIKQVLSENKGGFAYKTVSESGITGSSLEIIIEGFNSANDETYTVTNIQVIGDSKDPLGIGSLPAVEEIDGVDILKNYPNPFNIETTIQYVLTESMNISLHVYNFQGTKIKSLILNEIKDEGKHFVEWDGSYRAGEIVPSGSYIYVLEGNTKNRTIIKSKILNFIY